MSFHVGSQMLNPLAYGEAIDLAAHFVQRTERGLVERMTPAFAAMLDDA